MKILIIAYFFPPTNTIGALRPYGWAKYWSESGHNVTVLTTISIPHLLINSNKDIENFSILSVPHNDLLTKIKYKLKQLLGKKNYPIPSLTDLWWLKAYNQVKDSNYDLVISTYGPFINHWIAYLLKRKNNSIKWVADYRDLWTQNHFIKVNTFQKIFSLYLERRLNTRADLITTVSSSLQIKLKEVYHHKQVHLMENGFDKTDVIDLPQFSYWNDNKIHLIYTGTIYKGKQDIGPLISAVKGLVHKYQHLVEHPLQIDLIGEIPSEIVDIIEKEKLTAIIKYVPQIERKNCLHMQRDAHGLLFFEYTYADRNAILTGKIYEYLISRTIIIGIGTADNYGAGALIKNANAGINFGINHKAIQDYLETLIENKNKPMANINYEYLEQFDKKNLSMKLLQLVENIENH